jgi:phosphatidylglycerol lysyltransferase
LPDDLALYQAAGFNLLPVGQEAIVELVTFTLSGRSNKGLRSAVNRLIRLGYSFEFHPPPQPHGLISQLREISDEWLTSMHSTEKRFSVGWFDDRYIEESPLAIVCNPESKIEAFANLLSIAGNKQVSVDLMRYRSTTEHGVMDFLFASLFEWARDQGYETFDLGMSALSGIGQSSQDPAIERTLHYIYEHVDQFYNFKGLHEFKDKFHPIWSPRYLAYPGLASLPVVTLALIRADSGDDLLASYFRRD